MCKFGDGLSRPVLIARATFSQKKDTCKLKWTPKAMIYRVASRKAPRGLFSQVIYCRGYSGEEPPLPIPNREVKLTIADGTAPPGGRVGSCGSLECQTSIDAWHSSFMALWGAINQRTKPHVSPSPNPFPRGRGVGRFAPRGSGRYFRSEIGTGGAYTPIGSGDV